MTPKNRDQPRTRTLHFITTTSSPTQNNAMPTPAVSNPPNRPFPLAFTLVPLILYGLADLFPIPYLRISYFDLFTNTSEKHSIVSLGITPWLIAAGVVEFAAFIVPPWSALRHDESIGRAKLRRAVNIIGIFFAACGAYWIAFSLDPSVFGVGIASAPSWEFYSPFHEPRLIPSPNRAFVSLMAGAIFVKILADIVARRGLIHGFALFVAGGLLLSTIHAFSSATSIPEWRMILQCVATAITCAIVLGVVLVRLRGGLRKSRDDAAGPRKNHDAPRDNNNPYAPPRADVAQS